jgi:hypothetical protein
MKKPISDFLRGSMALLGLLGGTLSVLAQTRTPTSAPAFNWLSVASSANGTILAAPAQGQFANVPIYTSTDSGATWSFTNTWDTYWTFTASSADGTKLVGAAGGTSCQFGNWSDVPATPTLNLTNLRYEVSLPWADRNRCYRLAAVAP